MRSLIGKHKLKPYWGGQENLFLDLLENIIGQQLSIKVAKVIFNRFVGLFSTSSPSPADVLSVNHDLYHAQGLSHAKANYVKNIAQAVVDGLLTLDAFDQMSDEDIKQQLVKIKGVGPWTAEMFLIFSLQRPDVFSIGDLGLRTAIERLYGLSRNDQKAILALADTWRPHRSLASRLLWASLDNV